VLNEFDNNFSQLEKAMDILLSLPKLADTEIQNSPEMKLFLDAVSELYKPVAALSKTRNRQPPTTKLGPTAEYVRAKVSEALRGATEIQQVPGRRIELRRRPEPASISRGGKRRGLLLSDEDK
jgi:hypothetical protein